MREPSELTRRRALEGASTLAFALAGCLSESTRPDEPGSPGTDRRGSTPTAASEPPRTTSDRSSQTASKSPDPEGPTPRTATAERMTATRTAEQTTTTAGGQTDSILLPSLDVRGSPGDLVALDPPEKVVLLDFFATWCAPCEPEMDNLRAARDQFDRDTVFLVSITRETDEETIGQFWEDNRGTWPVVKDPGLRAFRQYGVAGLPTILVHTPDGTEVMRHTGLAGEDKIVSSIERALNRG